MEYICKLLDDTTKATLTTSRLLSLSRPFFEFKSERKQFDVLKQIYLEVEKCVDIDNITPTEDDLYQIKSWLDEYYESIPAEHRNMYLSGYNICSDIKIAMTIYFQTYCGYFSSADFENKDILTAFIKSNKTLSAQKTAYVKIPIAGNYIDQYRWIANNNDFIFTYDKDQADADCCDGISGTLHIHTVDYLKREEIKSPFQRFNGIDDRRISSLLKYVDRKYSEQSEERLMLRLSSYKPRESVAAFSNLYPNKCYKNIEEGMFYTLVSILRQAKNYPQYVYLKINSFCCTNFN